MDVEGAPRGTFGKAVPFRLGSYSERCSSCDAIRTLDCSACQAPLCEQHISGDEVEAWMTQNGLLEKSDAAADAPTDSACTDAQHAAMAAGQVGTLKFVG